MTIESEATALSPQGADYTLFGGVKECCCEEVELTCDACEVNHCCVDPSDTATLTWSGSEYNGTAVLVNGGNQCQNAGAGAGCTFRGGVISNSPGSYQYCASLGWDPIAESFTGAAHVAEDREPSFDISDVDIEGELCQSGHLCDCCELSGAIAVDLPGFPVHDVDVQFTNKCCWTELEPPDNCVTKTAGLDCDTGDCSGG